MVYPTDRLVVRLDWIIGKLLEPSCSDIFSKIPEIELVHQELLSLKAIINSSESMKLISLEEKIMEEITNFEAILDYHKSVSLRINKYWNAGINISPYVEDLKNEMNSFLHTIEKIKEKCSAAINSLLAADSVSPEVYDSGGKENIVGLEDEQEKLVKRLLEEYEELRIVSVVGMAGIGKSTLAKQVYNDQRILHNFERRAFLTLGHEYNVRNLYKDFLAQLCSNNDILRSDDELESDIYNALWNKRYLIVLDDMWSIDAFKSVMARFIPHRVHRSRIIITTRLLDLAMEINTRGVHQIRFLNKEESWKLFCKKVFVENKCPPELAKVGKKIVEKCEGLPLGIISDANYLLSNDDYMTLEYWEKVAENDSLLAAATNDGTKISKALNLSYEQLRENLQKCFLYLGVFPQNHEISVSKLVKLWIAEGLIDDLSDTRTFEQTANSCLENLISNSIVLIRQRNTIGKVKTCSVHSFFWRFCVKEAEKHNFFHIIRSNADTFSEKNIRSKQRRLCIHNNVLLGIQDVYKSMASASNACSILCTGPLHQYPVPVSLGLMLLRVLDALSIRFYKFPVEILELVELRYLAFTYNGKLPSSISRLQKLFYLIVHQYVTLINSSGGSPLYMPMEIWKMQELRHIQVVGSDLPDPPAGACLPNLLTLLDVSAQSCTKEVLKGIPKLKKLGVHTVLPHDHDDVIETLRLFDQFVEIPELKWVVSNPNPRSQVILLPDSIPYFTFCRISKLTLSGCGFAWNDMSLIGDLQYLYILKLRCYAFQGPEWELGEYEFPKLQFLVLEDTDLVHFRLKNHNCFPSLESIIIRHCYQLKVIPSQLAYNRKLRVMELVDCSPSALVSAKQIQEKRWDEGYEDFQLHFYCSWDDKKLRA